MIVVVAGTGRKAGKTSVTAGLIAALPDFNWVAIKISRHQHGLGWGVTEEHAPSATDTGRYLAAGARRAFWIRASEREMELAAAEVKRIAAANANVIIESNSVIGHLENPFVLVVMDRSVEQKTSAAEALRRADAIIMPGSGDAAAFAQVPCFVVKPPDYVTPVVAEFVRTRITDNENESEQ